LQDKARIPIEDFARNRSIIDMSVELSRVINRKIPSLSTFLKYSNYIEALFWEKKGRPIPPPHVYKQKTVKQYARLFSIITFIETGTYRGEMVEAIKTTFDRIYSIELDSTLYETAKQRFSKSRSITIIKGDSGRVLPELLRSIKSPCLFWLDAHYSSGITARGELETPIMKELQCILNHPIKQHVILIDDARLFVGQNDYPTIEELKRFVFNINPNLVIRIENNIIRVHP
jgi:hypothetical protein